MPLVYFLPILTMVVSIAFAIALVGRWRDRRSGPHLLWWAAGALTYAVGTCTEAVTTLFGWHEAVFRAWYISGALLGGAPLAQGTVYLLLPRRVAHRLTAVLLAAIVVAATCVLLAPVTPPPAEAHRLSGRVLEWTWVRAFSPFINLYALIFLVGGAAWSAARYARLGDSAHRAAGNTLIAVGALLPGIGGAFTRFGRVEVLYVTELVGLLLIIAGYHVITRRSSPGVFDAPVPVPTR